MFWHSSPEQHEIWGARWAGAHSVVVGEAIPGLLRVHGHHSLPHHNLAAVWLLLPHHHLEQRRLAGAVASNDACTARRPLTACVARLAQEPEVQWLDDV